MSELRKDPITGNWVIIAEERALRPSRFVSKLNADLDGATNPFAPGNEDMTPPEILRVPQLDSEDEWMIRVVPNKYPALAIEGDEERVPNGIYDQMNGLGAHEVIVESPDPSFQLHNLTHAHLTKAVATYQNRMRDLAKDERFKFSLLFRNSGANAGATVAHGHAQLIALPVIPPHVQARLDGAKRYFEFHGRNVFEDIIRQESQAKNRLVSENEAFICIAPYASRTPFELMIIPRQQASQFEQVDARTLESFASMLKDALSRLDACLGEVAYNFMIQSAPRDDQNSRWYRWHLQVVPKLTHVAGFEWGTGFYINPTPPEEAAKLLRSAL